MKAQNLYARPPTFEEQALESARHPQPLIEHPPLVDTLTAEVLWSCVRAQEETAQLNALIDGWERGQ